MAVTNRMYGKFYDSMARALVNWPSHSIKGLLVTSAYAFNQDTHQYKDVSITNELAAGGGYSAGGLVIPTPGLSYDAANHRVNFTGGNISWASATLTARGLVVYDDTPATNKPLVNFVDFGQDLSPVNGTLSVTWDAAGIAYVQVA